MKSPLFQLCLMIMGSVLCLPTLANAQCAGGSCGGGMGGFGGFFGGRTVYSAPAYYSAPRVVYESAPVTRSISSFSTSSSYTRDSEGYLIAPDGARVTAIDGNPIGPTRTAAKSTGSPATTVVAAEACECCRCEERLAAMEGKLDKMQEQLNEIEAKIPPVFSEADNTPGWQRALAERGQPLPGSPTVAMR